MHGHLANSAGSNTPQLCRSVFDIQKRITDTKDRSVVFISIYKLDDKLHVLFLWVKYIFSESV